MPNFLNNFRADEDGAVTVDWVILTAAVVGLGVAVMMSVARGTMEASNNVTNDIVETATTIDF